MFIKPEILAPAGDLTILKSAVSAGADAVYFGGDMFGARAYAHNFSIKDAEEGIRYAHAHGARAYLTVNTMLKNLEMEDHLYGYLKAYNDIGLDAVLVQDFGIFTMIRDCFPQMMVHVSTQSNIASGYGAELLFEQGASRVVLARELSLKEIREIHLSCPVELEVFVHGALCVCYSGQCLMSSMLGGRSGNRGRCAQPCRLPYDVYQDGKKLTVKGKYILSPKDLCGIRDIPELFYAGVSSLKIEGRMKNTEYAAGVCALYRKYTDKFAETVSDELDEADSLSEIKRESFDRLKEKYSVSDRDYQKLIDLGNRSGFTNSYFYKRNDPGMITYNSPSHTHEKAEEKAHSMVRSDAENVSESSDYKAEDYSERLSYPLEKIPSLYALDRGSHKKRSKKENVMVTVKTAEQMNVILDPGTESSFMTSLAIDYPIYLGQSNKELMQLRQKCRERHVQLLLHMPPVFRTRIEHEFLKKDEEQLDNFDGFLVTGYDALGFLKDQGISYNRMILDDRMYAFSDRTKAEFAMAGLMTGTVPYELNEKELSHRDLSFDYMTVYGRYALMYKADCTHRDTATCDQKRVILSLKDRKGAYFPVTNECLSCTNTVYNSLKTSLLSELESVRNLKPLGLRIDLTTENGKETAAVIHAFNSGTDIEEKTTKGHYHRGVE